MRNFWDTLAEQRWDDHRYYHQSRINQLLHFISAMSFVVAYGVLVFDPAIAALIGWLVSMSTRQAGHFFFEPKGYDHINQATHEYKEAIKVGYNLQRKVVLMSLWAGLPLVLWFSPTLWGWLTPYTDAMDYARRVGTAWLVLGVAAVLLRTAYLCVRKDAMTGLVWMTKILTDPFHDLMLYYKAPLYVWRREWFEPVPGTNTHHA